MLERTTPHLLLLTGPPGAGKTTLSSQFATHSPRSACVHADYFLTLVVNGFVAPWERAAEEQNRTLLRAASATAARLLAGGYDTVLEGILGPWHLNEIRDELRGFGGALSYVIVRPDLVTCLTRASKRVVEDPQHRDALSDEGPVRQLHAAFNSLVGYDRHVLDTTDQLLEESFNALRDGVARGTFQLH